MAAFDFATVADCSQLVNGPTHRAGGVLVLVLTNVPDLCDVHVHGNVGRSDHASLGVTLNLSPTVAGFDVARRVSPQVPELIGMPFVRHCLDLTGEVFSGVRPWFRILIGKSVELWRESTQQCHETLLSCLRPVIVGLHFVVLPSERVWLSGTCCILIRMVVWTRLVASLCFFQRTASVSCPKTESSFSQIVCVVVSFHWSGGLQMWLQFPKVPLLALDCN